MIATAQSRAALRDALGAWRRQGLRVALVPTMGNLHAGHLALVQQAREAADRVVASVFVNPTQFGPGEDFDRYPRTLEADAQGLAQAGCDLLFAPRTDAVYPQGPRAGVSMTAPVALSGVLCGAHRPGHFDGVVNVVCRLFVLVAPDVAVFGEKDFQQLRIIESMREDLGFDIAIARGATVREADGLAMSSRNRYLDAAERRLAPLLQQVLREAAGQWAAAADRDGMLSQARQRLADAGFGVEYLEARREVDLALAQPGQRDPVRIFVAARLGSTRLIDNAPVMD